MSIRYVFTSQYDPYTHHTGDLKSLGEIIYGVTGDKVLATRLRNIAGQMVLGEGFACSKPGLLITVEEDK